MRNSIIVAFSAYSLFIVSCGGAGDTSLAVKITEQPIGGKNISELTCTVRGILIGGETPITASIDWCWEALTLDSMRVVKIEPYTFTSSDEYEYVTTNHYAGDGNVFLRYWWVRVSWTDEDGTADTCESDKVKCTVGPPFKTLKMSEIENH